MGRGDIKTKKGKIFAGSFGKKRAAKPPKKKSTPKKKA
ncbi:MAG: 30S ribosomal protein THX [Chitinophagaceae bacterium]|jgi:30S ribosomal protein S31|nr:30S ribosomal protein THX [Chitinophagaceae bacterium]MBP6045497.1 30S ribosomal protein THX [Ferruginibacter sp.]NMD29596.1 30S ribosomal protein THX [Bacteroidota bacterium]MBK7089024.1 30S ribosomal protein THX [Chitinophagaceae bacterium]MBK8775109.1 30S ribosomal protein THX [Chitinophagaceae bacterium]